MSTFVSGQWNAICDRCGFKFKSGDLKLDWQGLRVCVDDFETRHPQDLIRVPAESPAPPWTRPVTEEDFVFICYLWDRSGYVGLGTVGCMQVGPSSLSYQLLVEMKG